MSMNPNIPIYCYWKIWPWKSKVHVMVEVNVESHTSHHGSNILSTHIPFIPSQSAIPFLRYSIFRLCPWKCKVMVMVEVKVENHKLVVIFYQLTSLLFHVNRPSHSWDTAFSKFDLKNPRPRSWVWWMLKATTCVQHYIDSHPFRSCQSAIPFLRYDFLKIWPWKYKVKVMVEVQVESHKVGVTSYQFTSLSSHVNQPSYSRDKAFSKFDLENSRSRSNDHSVAQLRL